MNTSVEYILCATIKRLKRRNQKVIHIMKELMISQIQNQDIDIMIFIRGSLMKWISLQKLKVSIPRKGRFVNRKEAYKIALKAGQIKKNRDFPNMKLLYSEDLY